MRTWLLSACVFSLPVAGCVLALPTRDYFDPDNVETVAVVDGVDAIAFSGSSLYISDRTRILAVSGDGSIADPVEITTSQSGLIFGLSGNGRDLVVWCEGSNGGVWYRLEGQSAQRVPGTTTCASVAAGADLVSYSDTIPGGITLHGFHPSTGQFDPDPASLAAPEDAPTLAFVTPDGANLTASAAGVLRDCLPGDTGCQAGFCRISSTQIHHDAVSLLAVGAVGSGGLARPLLVTEEDATLLAGTTACCAFGDAVCTLDPFASHRGLSSGDAFAVRNGVLYTQHSGRIFTVPSFGDPSQDEPAAVAALGAQLLAVSDAHAFYVDGRKVQRAPLFAPADNAGCVAGTRTCGAVCVSDVDPLYGCGNQTCARCDLANAGAVLCDPVVGCTLTACEAPFADCDHVGENGCEADLTSPDSCRSCGNVCIGSQACSSKGCGSCDPGDTACDRRCVTLATDIENCGACGVVCPSGPSGTAVCQDGKCALSCQPQFFDCDGNPTNGCEPLKPNYADTDADGYGAGPSVGSSCKNAPLGAMLSFSDDDCLDTDARVHPKQTSYFATAYTNTNGALSFDYDCDNAETAAPGEVSGGCDASSAGGGGAVSVCKPGYAPAGRAGAQNPICGSTSKFTCSPDKSTGSCPTANAPSATCR